MPLEKEMADFENQIRQQIKSSNESLIDDIMNIARRSFEAGYYKGALDGAHSSEVLNEAFRRIPHHETSPAL